MSEMVNHRLLSLEDCTTALEVSLLGLFAWQFNLHSLNFNLVLPSSIHPIYYVSQAQDLKCICGQACTNGKTQRINVFIERNCNLMNFLLRYYRFMWKYPHITKNYSRIFSATVSKKSVVQAGNLRNTLKQKPRNSKPVLLKAVRKNGSQCLNTNTAKENTFNLGFLFWTLETENC